MRGCLISGENRKRNLKLRKLTPSRFSGSSENQEICKGFPLKVKGRVTEPCWITDLGSNGIMDLIAVDQAGYMNAFELPLGKGISYMQPWPSKFGDPWKTGNRLYRGAGSAGYLYEQWQQGEVHAPPYRWFETGTNNSLTETTGSFSYHWYWLQTAATGGKNYHFTGPNMSEASKYTITGTFKFDNTNAEFGVNFYSQWPETAKKYTLMRENGGALGLYYYSNDTTRQLLGSVSANDTMHAVLHSGTWYNYKICVNPVPGSICRLSFYLSSFSHVNPA